MKNLFFPVFSVVFFFSFTVSAKGKHAIKRGPSSIKGYRCTGTEPGFDVSVDGNKVTFSTPEGTKLTYQTSGPKDAAGVTSGNAISYRSQHGELVLALSSSTLAGGACTDGMSDNKYAYHLMVVMAEKSYYGCCEPLAQD